MSFSKDRDFFEMWRFEECPDLVWVVACGNITLFNQEQSKTLWSMFVSSNAKHLMRMDVNIFSKIEHYDVDFNRKESTDELLFLPSDETTIIITPQNSHFLFSYEERFLF